jgi:hypothetical protein
LQEQSVADAFRSIGVAEAIQETGATRLFPRGTPDQAVTLVDLYQTQGLIRINLQHESLFLEFISDIFNIALPQLCLTAINGAILARLRGRHVVFAF